MTEAEWLQCRDPDRIPVGNLSKRKLRLFGCACVRRIWHLLPDPRSRRAVELAELYADGAAGVAELAEAWQAAGEAEDQPPREPARYAAWATAALYSDLTEAAVWGGRSSACLAAARGAHPGAPRTPGLAVARRAASRAEAAAQADLLRDVAGNPFRPPPPGDPAWLAWHGGAVVKLAQAVYDERELPSGHRDAARLAVLADMLEEAGATDPRLLGHLRGPGPHVRGCVVIDALLGRS